MPASPLDAAAGVDGGGIALLTIVLVAVALVVVYTLRLGAPPWPTTPRAARVLLGALPDHVDGDVLELGCGWGGLALALAARYRGHRVIGAELSPVPWAIARLRRLAGRVSNLEVRRADLHRVDLSQAGLIVCYLQGPAMARLAERAVREAPRGCWLVSNTFALPGLTPIARHPVGDVFGTTILVYRLPGGDGDPADPV